MSEPLQADEVARKDFPLSFRGFDQREVRSLLGQVAAELGSWEERERTLRARIAELEATPDAQVPDEAALEIALGREATRVLHAAREAAAEIRAKADVDSGQMLERAEATLAKATKDATDATEAIRAEVEGSLAALREETERRAAAILEESRAKAAAMMVDATAERDRIVRDLGDRRAALVAEIEGLHAARLRLTEAFDAVRGALDTAVRKVVDADAVASTAVTTSDAPTPAPAVAIATPDPAPVMWPRAEPATEHVADAAIASEVVPEPEAEPVVTAEPAPDERRSSALKLLRRKAEPLGSPVAPPVDDPHEGVRIIRPEPKSDPEPEAAGELTPALEVELAASTPEPEIEPESEEAPEPVAPAVEHAEAPVEDLFARLRADRAEKVARAEAVLAVTDASPSGEAEPVAPAAVLPRDDLSPDLALLSARDAAVADAERGLVRSLKRALADEQNEVLDALRRLRGTPSIVALLPDSAVHDARYDAVLSGGAALAAAEGGAVGGGIGGNAAAVAAEIGASVAADLRSRIDRSIEDASGDVETLAEAISSTYREWKMVRVEPLAHDVIAASFAAGVYSASDGPLRWVVDPAEGGCPDCDDNALAGPTPKGTAFPTGQLHPPAHAGCRCAVVPAS